MRVLQNAYLQVFEGRFIDFSTQPQVPRLGYPASHCQMRSPVQLPGLKYTGSRLPASGIKLMWPLATQPQVPSFMYAALGVQTLERNLRYKSQAQSLRYPAQMFSSSNVTQPQVLRSGSQLPAQVSSLSCPAQVPSPGLQYQASGIQVPSLRYLASDTQLSYPA